MWAFLLAVRHSPDRLLHRRRRQAAAERLKGMGAPRSALFLCHGNVCRSPFAEAYVARALSSVAGVTMRCTSAGFIGPGRRPPDEAIAAGGRRGVDLSGHRSALVTERDMESSDIVIVMSAQQAARVASDYPGHSAKVIVFGDLDPMGIDKRTILDPWNGDAARFDACYDRIARCADSLIALTSGAHAR